MVPGSSTSSSSSLPSSTSTTPARQEIDHPKSSSRSSTSPPMTSSTVSSESVERQERGDPYSSEASEELLTKPNQNYKFRFEKGKMRLTVTFLQCQCLNWLMMDQGNLRKSKPTKTKNQKPNKKETTIERRNPLDSEIPEWLQEFREILVDDRVPEHRDSHVSSSHELSSEPTCKRREDLGKHSVYTHFPKDRNCEICKRTKITRAPCRRRNGEAVPRAENFGDLITADHKVFSEGCDSRNNHRYAVVVQDVATQWIQVVSVQNKNFSGNTKDLAKVLGAE